MQDLLPGRKPRNALRKENVTRHDLESLNGDSGRRRAAREAPEPLKGYAGSNGGWRKNSTLE
jgi:hypothetical protein